MAFGRLKDSFKNPDISIHLKAKVFNTCFLPVLTYAMETTTEKEQWNGLLLRITYGVSL